MGRDRLFDLFKNLINIVVPSFQIRFNTEFILFSNCGTCQCSRFDFSFDIQIAIVFCRENVLFSFSKFGDLFIFKLCMHGSMRNENLVIQFSRTTKLKKKNRNDKSHFILISLSYKTDGLNVTETLF